MATDSEVAKVIGEIFANFSASGAKELTSWRSPEGDPNTIRPLDCVSRLDALLDPSLSEEVVRAGQVVFSDLSQSDDPALTADIVPPLAADPAPLAREIFDCPRNLPNENGSLAPDRTLVRILEHYHSRFGLRLGGEDIPASRKLNYLGGIIHFAKLRSALLDEYGV